MERWERSEQSRENRESNRTNRSASRRHRDHAPPPAAAASSATFNWYSGDSSPLQSRLEFDPPFWLLSCHLTPPHSTQLAHRSKTRLPMPPRHAPPLPASPVTPLRNDDAGSLVRNCAASARLFPSYDLCLGLLARGSAQGKYRVGT